MIFTLIFEYMRPNYGPAVRDKTRYLLTLTHNPDPPLNRAAAMIVSIIKYICLLVHSV